MPILEVELVVDDNATLPATLAADIARCAAAVFGIEPGRTWVRLRALPLAQYAEDSGLPPDIKPVFVNVLHYRQPGQEALVMEVAQLTQAIAGACERPAENVHLIYAQDGAGRVAFGGHLVT